MKDLTPYLHNKHNYEDTNCVSLLSCVYNDVLGIKLDIPDYPKSRKWLTAFTTDSVDSWALNCAIKVSLTDAKNYDLIVFKSSKSNRLTHFALYVEHNKMFHVEEDNYSKIELLSDYWRDNIYAVYRHEQMV